MARKRASMREGPLAELFRATEAAQRQAEAAGAAGRARSGAGAGAGAAAAGARAAAGRRGTDPGCTSVPRREPEPAAATPGGRRGGASRGPPGRARCPSSRRGCGARRGPTPRYLAVIRVVGVGGAGLNAVDRMIDAGLTGVEFVAVNTDIQQLQMNDAPLKIHIGRELTEGLGSGADPDIGRAAAEEAYDQIKRALRGSDMVFVAAGEGGGTGSGAAPVVAQIARELGALAVGIVTTPFRFEGTRRRSAADAGVDALRERLRHGDRHPERPPARGAREEHRDAGRLPDRRRRPPPGRPGHHRPDHACPA